MGGSMDEWMGDKWKKKKSSRGLMTWECGIGYKRGCQEVGALALSLSVSLLSTPLPPRASRRIILIKTNEEIMKWSLIIY